MTDVSEWRIEQFGPGRFKVAYPDGQSYTMHEFRRREQLLRCPVCSSRVSVHPMPMIDLSGNEDKFTPGNLTCLGECGNLTTPSR
jgi:hypothetical protein